jgi:hypothetical protein
MHEMRNPHLSRRFYRASRNCKAFVAHKYRRILRKHFNGPPRRILHRRNRYWLTIKGDGVHAWSVVPHDRSSPFRELTVGKLPLAECAETHCGTSPLHRIASPPVRGQTAVRHSRRGSSPDHRRRGDRHTSGCGRTPQRRTREWRPRQNRPRRSCGLHHKRR